MKSNEYGGNSEAYTLPCPASDAPHMTEADRIMSYRFLARGDSPADAVRAVASSRSSFPLRTLMVCFTIWLIATQAMVFDQVKFYARAQLLEQAARSLGGPQVVVPSKRPSPLSSGKQVQRL
jgi:hypothetical protein